MALFTFSIGDIVEVFCDHKRGGRRVRDWIEGVIVHADDRMIAIQFRNDVYLTDGWMVPDRILWFNKGTDKIRPCRKGHPSALVPKTKKAKPAVRKPAPKQAKSRAMKPAKRSR